jgi:hypothetical protein
LLESDVLIVELAQQSELVYGVLKESSIKEGLLIRLEGFVLTFHLIGEVKLGNDVVLAFEKLENGVQPALIPAFLQNLRFPCLYLPFPISFKVNVLFCEIQLAQHHFVLFLEWYLIALIAHFQRELSIFKLEQSHEECLASEYLIFGHFGNKFSDCESLDGVVDVGDSQEQTDEQYFLIVEEVLGDVAVRIENAAVELMRLPPLNPGLYCETDLVQQGIQPLLQLALPGHYKFFIEMVAVDVDWCTLIDLAGH